MNDTQTQNLAPTVTPIQWQRQYIRNALATLGQLQTEDKELAGYILNAERALRKAKAHLGE